MEFGKKLRLPMETYKSNPIAEELAFTQLVHVLVDEIPTKYLRKMFNLDIIDPSTTDFKLKMMNPALPPHIKAVYEPLSNANQVEFSVSIKINKDGTV